jgi:hypothetical protein
MRMNMPLLWSLGAIEVAVAIDMALRPELVQQPGNNPWSFVVQ